MASRISLADLEGLTKILLENGKNKDEIIDILVKEYQFYKKIATIEARSMAEAVITEVQNTQKKPESELLQKILEIPLSGVTMGEQGVGCRGQGDFHVHELISSLSETKIKPVLSPKSLDDCGAIMWKNANDTMYIVSKMEGMHSRLSDFPFFAGFHVTRAALRDLYVKGAIPVSLMVDIHLADDADIGKLFDFMIGVSTVAELTSVPITAGSTLRIGGDMVIGSRITGGIAGLGVARKLLARKNIRIGDDILMSEGAGGGTIVTTALYGGKPDVALETMNIQFLKASQALLENPIMDEIHACTDVTNGGLRGDLYEIAKEANVGMQVVETKVKELVNPKVLQMLNDLNVDYMGVSLDALLIFCPKNITRKIINIIQGAGVKIHKIGEVVPKDQGITCLRESGEVELIPHFRESAYTKIKKVVGEDLQESRQALLAKKVTQAYESALKKKEIVVKWMQERGETR